MNNYDHDHVEAYALEQTDEIIKLLKKQIQVQAIDAWINGARLMIDHAQLMAHSANRHNKDTIVQMHNILRTIMTEMDSE